MLDVRPKASGSSHPGERLAERLGERAAERGAERVAERGVERLLERTTEAALQRAGPLGAGINSRGVGLLHGLVVVWIWRFTAS